MNPLSTLPNLREVPVYLWLTDALSKRPYRTTYPHRRTGLGNGQLVSSIGVPLRTSNLDHLPHAPTVVGWSPVE